jgi:hypothetical protein
MLHMSRGRGKGHSIQETRAICAPMFGNSSLRLPFLYMSKWNTGLSRGGREGTWRVLERSSNSAHRCLSHVEPSGACPVVVKVELGLALAPPAHLLHFVALWHSV